MFIKIIKKLKNKKMDKALSNYEISAALNNEVRVIKYEDLPYFHNIAELLFPYGCCVINYPIEVDTGHWVAVFYSKNSQRRKIVEFFDPYGMFPDDEFLFSKSNKTNPHYLAQILLTSPYPIEYNEIDYQKKMNGVDTCGRHVINRLLHRNLTMKKYNSTFGPASGHDPDTLVTYLTEGI
jgi:hypothetical protein